jgi:putative ABC transport system ATP-binding protein
MTGKNNTDTPLLVVNGLQLRRGSSSAPLLDNISASVFAGDRISLEGGSGAGKSLFLRSITLLEIFNDGQLLWKGNTILQTEIPLYRSHVIYLHQRPSLGEGTVEDCLRQVFSLKIHRGKEFPLALIRAYLEEIGLEESFLHKDVRQLSGGEAQVIALLRAIQLNPQILLLDEPTAALDALKTAVVEKMVDRWLAETPETRAYVWVTHNKEQAVRVSNKVWKMDQGKLGTIKLTNS